LFNIFDKHSSEVYGGIVDLINNQLITYSNEIIIWNYKEGSIKKKINIVENNDLIY